MASTSTFSALTVANSGLKAAQTMVDVTAKNIAHANDEHYTRQRAVSHSLPPRTSRDKWHYEIAGGVKNINIERVHDEFVYARYRQHSTIQEASKYLKDSLEHVAIYFPEVDGFGVSNELDNYFDAWASLITNPSESANKVNLSSVTQRLVSTIKELRGNIKTFQKKTDDELKTLAEEINQIAKEIAHLNSEIFRAVENQKKVNNITVVNELKDRRDHLELALAKLVNIEVGKDSFTSNNISSDAILESGSDYVLNVSGFNIIDGTNFNRLETRVESNAQDFVDLKFVRQDFKEFSMSNFITSGKIGAILDLRGRSINKEGSFDDGMLQGYLNSLDAFTKTLINNTNSIYSKTITDRLRSNKPIFQDVDRTLLGQVGDMKKGSFFISIIDIDDKIIGTKEIFINQRSSIREIQNQINSNNDDNNDGAPSNDIDDTFEAKIVDDTFYIEPIYGAGKYRISIDDNGTNFAGSLGLNRFFDGNDAKDITLAYKIKENASTISTYTQSEQGKGLIANDMTQLRYDFLKFETPNGEVNATLGDFLTQIITQVSSDGAVAIDDFKTKNTIYEQIKGEFHAIGKVSVDEELINLIRFQSGYTANAKVITTIDEMLKTVLGLKQ